MTENNPFAAIPSRCHRWVELAEKSFIEYGKHDAILIADNGEHPTVVDVTALMDTVESKNLLAATILKLAALPVTKNLIFIHEVWMAFGYSSEMKAALLERAAKGKLYTTEEKEEALMIIVESPERSTTIIRRIKNRQLYGKYLIMDYDIGDYDELIKQTSGGIPRFQFCFEQAKRIKAG